jgi:TolA-binding protein
MAPRQKSSTLSLIFAMLIQAAMVIWAVADIKKDVEILKSRVATQQDRDDRQDKTLGEVVSRLQTQLERMDGKLERLIEKRP